VRAERTAVFNKYPRHYVYRYPKAQRRRGKFASEIRFAPVIALGVVVALLNLVRPELAYKPSVKTGMPNFAAGCPFQKVLESAFTTPMKARWPVRQRVSKESPHPMKATLADFIGGKLGAYL